MKLLFLLFALSFSTVLIAQDLTGTWEGDFMKGTIGTREKSKMSLELVEFEGKLYGIFRLFPVDTKVGDAPNVIYTVEGKRAKFAEPKFALYKGRVVESLIPDRGKDFFQFTANYKNDQVETISGTWFESLEPLNSRERGAGTFRIHRVNDQVSDLLKGKMKEKQIANKIRE
ncbi:MAG TPA: hypothetical protein VJT83_04775 [Chitinophagaceae bacterium]|nr:hypothetical protein [Chitinophagaceae bacterium]